jgi:hypothetical protein
VAATQTAGRNYITVASELLGQTRSDDPSKAAAGAAR